MTTAERFAVCLARLTEVFRVDLTPSLAESYWEALAAWPIEALEGAAKALIAGSRFFPKPVEWADAAAQWRQDRQLEATSMRVQLAASNEPPLRAEDVRALVAHLGAKLHWGETHLSPAAFEQRKREALDQAAQLMRRVRDEATDGAQSL